MVKIEKFICGNPPALQTRTHFICDSCGAECNPDGADFEKLWDLEDHDGHLCEACLKEVIDWEWIKDFLKYNDWLHEVRE